MGIFIFLLKKHLICSQNGIDTISQPKKIVIIHREIFIQKIWSIIFSKFKSSYYTYGETDSHVWL